MQESTPFVFAPFVTHFAPHSLFFNLQLLIFLNPFDSNNQLSLTRSTVYAFEPLHEISNTPLETSTWFVKVSELSSGSVRVEDIFYRFTNQNLSEMLPKSLNLLDYRLKEITTAYGLLQYPIFQKMVVSSDEFAIMTLFSGGKLGVYRKGDEEWTYIDFSGDGIFFEDIVYHMEKIYALGSKGLTITVDSKSLDISQVAAPVANANGYSKYLIKSLEDIFFVDEGEFDNCLEKSGTRSYPIHLNVLKLDEEKRQWIQVMNSLDLKDRVLFCSSIDSFSVSAKEFLDCKMGFIYISDYVFSEDNDHPGSDAAIFYLEDNTLVALSDFPGSSNIFWPPPPWLKH